MQSVSGGLNPEPIVAQVLTKAQLESFVGADELIKLGILPKPITNRTKGSCVGPLGYLFLTMGG